MNYPIHIDEAQEISKAQSARLNLIGDGDNGFQMYSLVTGDEDGISLYCCPDCDYLNEADDICEHCCYGEQV